MKMLRLSLIASIAVAVAACSGGGSGSKSSVVSSSTGSSSGSGSTQPVNPNPPAKTAEYQGSMVAMVSNTFTTEAVKATSHAQANKLIVEGVEINLTPNHFVGVPASVTLISEVYARGKNGTLYTHLQNVKYGVARASGSDHLFFIGKPTQEMPKSGKATYNGYAIIYSKARNGSDPDWTSTFEVDFATNKLTGRLGEERSGTGFYLKADIEGNGFKGTHNGNYTEGRFFGTNASELSGVFSAEIDDFTGVYGAKKSN